MRIRQIEQTNFRCSEHTMFRTFAEANKKLVASLGRDDVIVFISKMGNQILFVHNTQRVDKDTFVVASVKKRLVGGAWNPLRLRNYAEDAGLKIQGLKLFEEHYSRLTTQEQRAAK